MTTPCKGGGQFQWNTGGWFGAQIGATAYLVLLGAALARQMPRAGLLLILCGLLPNLIGTWLWMRRDRLAPYPALQLFVGIIFVFTAIALGSLIFCGPCLNVLPRCSAEAWRVSWILLIYPALMLMFHFQEKQARRQSAPPQQKGPP